MLTINNNARLNHYLHFGVKTAEELAKRISTFGVTTLDFSVKLNIASFYTPDNVPHTPTDTVEDVMKKALSMHLHYQFAYLPLFVQTIDAFTQYHLPLSVLDGPRKQSIQQAVGNEVVPYKYHFHMYVFFSDI